MPVAAFGGYRLIEVDRREPHGANALFAGGSVLYAASCPATAARLGAEDIDVQLLDISEIAKAEGAVTCCSLLIA